MVFGGVGQEPQVQAVQRGLSILVATPGRLLDLMGQGYVHLEHIEVRSNLLHRAHFGN